MNDRKNSAELPDTEAIKDFRLQLIVLITGVAFVFVSPFAVYRYIHGPMAVAVLDILVVLTTAAIAVYARRTGQIERAGKAMGVVLGIAAVAVTVWIGINGAVWIYTIILFVFYLVPAAFGLAIVLPALAAIAALQLAGPGSVFDSPVQMASFLASATAITIFSWFCATRNRQQRTQLLQWATRDPLTGLENRRRLEPELRVAVEAGRRYRRGYGLIIMDADNFKKINDEQGHAAGDKVLQSLADTIASTTRIEDRAFRYGGDEFIIILPDITYQGLEIVSNKLVQQIAARGQSDGNGITVSIGAALLRPDEERDSWNRRADQSMYRAKQLGGDRCLLDR